MRRLLLLLFCLPCWAGTQLDTLQASLVDLRGKWGNGQPLRGATPKLTGVKHQFRDWIESRISSLGKDDDPRELASKLNGELQAAGMTCGYDGTHTKCPEWALLGFVSDIELHRSGEFLVLITGAGIECGSDNSACLYRWTEPQGWRRVWQNEQNV
jgi:hypothetical protein